MIILKWSQVSVSVVHKTGGNQLSDASSTYKNDALFTVILQTYHYPSSVVDRVLESALELVHCIGRLILQQ